MKNLIKKFCCGLVTAIGIEVGLDLFRKVKNPESRVKIKKKIIAVKNAIFSKEES